MHTTQIFDYSENITIRFSFYDKVLAVTAYMFRFIYNVQRKSEPQYVGPLTVKGLRNALIVIVRIVRRKFTARRYLYCLTRKLYQGKTNYPN